MDRTTAKKIRQIMHDEQVSESTARRWLKDGRSKAGRGPGSPMRGQDRAAKEAVRAFLAGEIGVQKTLEISGLGLRTLRRRKSSKAIGHKCDATS